MPHFDAIVIGSGQAGPSLTARLTGAGMSVGFIEREHFGGTCVNDGCTPTKALVASAQVAHVARRAGDYGVRVPPPIEVDMRAVKARKDAISGRSRTGVENWLRGMRGCTIFWGQGRFTGPKSVSVNGESLTADKIFINVGARPSVPPIPGLDQVPYLTNTSMMAVDFLPAHLVILGGSYVGLEFAQMYRRFGSAVTLIEAQPRLIAREDEDVSAEVARILEREEIALRLGAKALSVARRHNSRSRSRRRKVAPRSKARIFWSRSGVGRTPTISGSTRPVSRSTRVATSPLMINCAPTFRASGRWATATARARSRTRPTTTTRSSPPTCSTTTIVG